MVAGAGPACGLRTRVLAWLSLAVAGPVVAGIAGGVGPAADPTAVVDGTIDALGDGCAATGGAPQHDHLGRLAAGRRDLVAASENAGLYTQGQSRLVVSNGAGNCFRCGRMPRPKSFALRCELRFYWPVTRWTQLDAGVIW